MQDSITLSAGKSISKERWIYTNNLRNPLKIEKEKIIKSSLELFQLNLEKKFLELFRFDPEVSLKLLKAEITQKKKIITQEVTIMEIMVKHNDFFKRKVAAGERAAASLQKYERAADLIHVFMNKQYQIDDLPAQQISSAVLSHLSQSNIRI